MRRVVARIGGLALVGAALFGGTASAAPGALTYLETRAGDVGAVGARGLVMSPDGRHVYVAGTNAGAVVAYGRGPDGRLTYLGCVRDPGKPAACGADAEGLGSPQYVAISPDGRTVYAAGDSAVVALHRDADTGLLTDGGCWSDTGSSNACGAGRDVPALGGAEGVVVSPDGLDVYVGAQGDKALNRFTRDPGTGALTYSACIADATAGCTATPVNAFLYPREITISPDGRTVYGAAANSGVAAFARAGDGSLSYLQTMSALAPVLVVGVTVSPDNRFVYTGSVNRSAVYAFQRDPSTGALTDAGCAKQPASAATCSVEHPGLGGVEGVAVSPDGASLYATSYYSSALSVFDRSRATGGLTPAGCFRDLPGPPVGCGAQVNGLGASRAVALSPDGRNVYATGQSDGAVTVFARELPPAEPPVEPTASPAAPSPSSSGSSAPTGTAPPAVTLAAIATLPSAKRCVSRRSFAIRLRHPSGTRITSATVKIGKKVVATRKGSHVTAPIDLRGLPKGRFTVAISVRLADGRTVKGSRAYRTCAPKKRR